jgi:hypothetical protein
MSKTLLTALVVASMLRFTAQAQTTPTGTTASSTAGTPMVETSNNPVDATGKPVGTPQSTKTSTGKTRKPKN